jgi:alkanesulfonate monooxygenase SsuD/methylene tetrahydromethanopterin reductase-like flavin-dependent oxidoreductase (luciferase family)
MQLYGYGGLGPAKDRFDRLEDALQLLPLLWGPGSPAFEGKTISTPAATCYPRPVQEKIPIIVGGGGEKRTLRLVAQYADMCNVSGGPATIAHKLDVLRTHCKDVGRDPSEITTTRLGTLVLTNDAAETAGTTEFLRGLAGAELDEQFVIGEPDDVVRKVGTLIDTGLDCLIFNMPLSQPDAVARAGNLLTSTFS